MLFRHLRNFLKILEKRAIILRHDVDDKKLNSLQFAEIQNTNGVRGSYYFRFLKNHFDAGIIRKISELNHEIGYHYDDLSHCNGDYNSAIERFQQNLSILREIAPVSTICMEGAPLSRYDNRDLWKKYKFGNYGIQGEPYFNLDFNNVFYLSDTGRNWGQQFNLRDRATVNQNKFFLKINSTKDLIKAVNQKLLPDQVMVTFHPQRWNNNFYPWLQELVFQNVKNQIKRFLTKNSRFKPDLSLFGNNKPKKNSNSVIQKDGK